MGFLDSAPTENRSDARWEVNCWRPPDGGMWRVSLRRNGAHVWNGMTFTRIGAHIAASRARSNYIRSGDASGET